MAVASVRLQVLGGEGGSADARLRRRRQQRGVVRLPGRDRLGGGAAAVREEQRVQRCDDDQSGSIVTTGVDGTASGTVGAAGAAMDAGTAITEQSAEFMRELARLGETRTWEAGATVVTQRRPRRLHVPDPRRRAARSHHRRGRPCGRAERAARR
jgi:hypothetical protein